MTHVTYAMPHKSKNSTILHKIRAISDLESENLKQYSCDKRNVKIDMKKSTYMYNEYIQSSIQYKI